MLIAARLDIILIGLLASQTAAMAQIRIPESILIVLAESGASLLRKALPEGRRALLL
ncbi:hypothetical protein [Cupriavidus pinatubonensis]|uniref:hypothetical protein n=1 Tax=Cupriavidus pinatubonensis TaxID=248026 RepID=UPI00215A0858|nr:hypothetical protein [Cupriavidus pinatubonensis]